MSNSLSVSLIVIGDEILNGRTVDLNGNWLSKFLFKTGMELKSMQFIRDNESEMKAALTRAFTESDVVITSGGIGPTIDDKTKKVMANYFNEKIIEREDIAQMVTDNYLRFGRVWDKTLNHYHYFPENFIGIKNPKGLAPGLGYYHQTDTKILLSGPGVPREFQAMVEQEFYPLIANYFPTRFKENFQVVIRTQGIPEEKIFNQLCPELWQELEQFGKVSSLPHTIGIDIVVSFFGNQNLYEEYLEKIKKIIQLGPLNEFVWQYGNLSLPQLILKKSQEKKLTYAFAESCTGGLTSSKITDLSGASQNFYGSIVAYDNSVKVNLLKVSPETLNSVGAVSIQCVKEMAKGLKDILKVDYAVSISGIAGPTGATDNKPVGTVAIGVCSKNKNEGYLFQYPGDRIRLKDRFADKALLCLLELMSEN
jgi:nicotinamide-nucleotide amidase